MWLDFPLQENLGASHAQRGALQSNKHCRAAMVSQRSGKYRIVFGAAGDGEHHIECDDWKFEAAKFVDEAGVNGSGQGAGTSHPAEDVIDIGWQAGDKLPMVVTWLS